ncbi:DUF5320 domain-containing protein [bacterium]|nr:DUF5320 domain-containing protein [bacterium]
MPGGDRTGPSGTGPLTGRAAGYCAGYDDPGFANPGPRRGFGRRFGRGLQRRLGWEGGRGRNRRGLRFHRQPFYSEFCDETYLQPLQGHQPTREEELEYLSEEAKHLKQHLRAVEKRIKDMEKPNVGK